MESPQYPEGRNKYHREVYNFNAALNRALKNGPPLASPTMQGPAIQTLQRDPFAPVFHIPRHAAKKNLYTAMTTNPKYSETIRKRLFNTALPKINALRQMKEYQELEPKEQQDIDQLIKMQYVYLPTSYEADLNANLIEAAAASRRALGLPPAGRTHKNANRPSLPPPKSRKNKNKNNNIPEVLTPAIEPANAANALVAAPTRRRLNINKETRRAISAARLAHIKETDPARYNRLMKARKRRAESLKARAAAQNSQEQVNE